MSTLPSRASGLFLAAATLITLAACSDAEQPHPVHELPIIGERTVVNGDTIYPSVGDWSFYRQDSARVSEDDLQGTPYVVDFFFTSCPTICPRVTSNMLRVRERFADTPLKLVSFTIDPKRDSVGRLRTYSQNMGVADAEQWWFLTGDKAELYGIADDYFSVAVEDPETPGGFDHSGRILFVDERGQVRAFADGTDTTDVNHLMADIAGYLERETQAGASN